MLDLKLSEGIHPNAIEGLHQGFRSLLRDRIPHYFFDRRLVHEQELGPKEVFSVAISKDWDHKDPGARPGQTHMTFIIRLKSRSPFFETKVRCPKLRLVDTLPLHEGLDLFFKNLREIASSPEAKKFISK